MSGVNYTIHAEIDTIPAFEVFGQVTKVLGLLVEMAGFPPSLTVGARVDLKPKGLVPVPCEVIGFQSDRALLMPFGTLDGIGLGCPAVIKSTQPVIHPSDQWLGRVVNALGEPIDGKGPLPQGDTPMTLRAKAPSAHSRQRIGEKLNLGVRAVNSFTTLCKGQRIGIFAGSGVGKSVLLSMMARYTAADVTIIGLVGERGREVQEFIEDDLGEEGLKRSVVVVSTGDEPALMRRQAAYVTMALAEYYRAKGLQVLCLIDSVTRFAMAQREIGLSAGEPPTAKGYPPTTFGELTRLLERAGPGGPGEGMMTGVFTVLVEGDDTNEPVADTVRGILDGHIIMERAIADRGRYPAINVLRSVSRSLPGAFSKDQALIYRRAKQVISTYENMAELIRLGAYRKGSDPDVDEAIGIYPEMEAFLDQRKEENNDIDECFTRLAEILGMDYTPENPMAQKKSEQKMEQSPPVESLEDRTTDAISLSVDLIEE